MSSVTASFITHVFQTAGTYQVAVKYFDDDGQESSNIYVLEVKLGLRESVYYLKVHLGSIKVTVNDSGTVKGYDDLDANGKILEGRSMNNANPNDPYKFTGKERDDETSNDYFS